MPSTLLKLAELGFTAAPYEKLVEGKKGLAGVKLKFAPVCYREGECQHCHFRGLTWYWHSRWICDDCVLNSLLPEPEQVQH